MKIVFFFSYYETFLNAFYNEHPGYSKLCYEEQKQNVLNTFFGYGGSYYNYALNLGCEADIIIPNCKPMQYAWSQENGVPFYENDWQYSIPLAQTKKFCPDIFYIGSMFNYYGSFLDEISRYSKKIVGWIACPYPSDLSLDRFSLILSSSQDFVETFRKTGTQSELLPATFDPNVLNYLPCKPTIDIPFSFVGSISPAHTARYNLLTKLVNETPLELWGVGFDELFKAKTLVEKIKNLLSKNEILRRHHGEAWGLDAYKVLQRSKITFNSHIDVAGDLCGNMRMYEATGVGTLLLTDFKKNLPDLFVPGKEVVTYSSIDDAIEKVVYYLQNDKEREKIASAGQKRTIFHYNMEKHVEQMIGYFKKLFQ